MQICKYNLSEVELVLEKNFTLSTTFNTLLHLQLIDTFSPSYSFV